MLSSNVPLTEELVRVVFEEDITRNVHVVRTLDARGANLPELSILEAEDGNDYRLEQTFNARLPSLHLLMSQRLTQRTMAEARMKDEGSKMTLDEMKAALFRRHGAPPDGAAARLATSIRQHQTRVTTWPQFLSFLGVVILDEARSGFVKTV